MLSSIGKMDERCIYVALLIKIVFVFTLVPIYMSLSRNSYRGFQAY